MALVEYDSDSGSSDSEAPVVKPAVIANTPTATGKKPFQKLVDRANPGKIRVSLPATTAGSADGGDDGDGSGEQRPAKRARVAGAGGSRFSGFGSLLPPPKKTTAAATTSSTSLTSSSTRTPSGTARPGINLKTSGDIAFHRNDSTETTTTTDEGSGSSTRPSAGAPSSTLSLPPPKGPRVADGQKAAEDVKLVGSAMMFVPLSVSRKPGKKPKKAGAAAAATTTSGTPAPAAASTDAPSTIPNTDAEKGVAKPKKKISLFSIDTTTPGDDDDGDAANMVTGGGGEYQPLFGQEQHQPQEEEWSAAPPPPPPPIQQQSTASLGALADELQLSARERRELFGRGGTATAAAAAATRLTATFDMDKEYRHNEALRQAGEQDAQAQAHNPVRAVQPGKHSLRQLVNAVQGQQEAFEETFAKNRAAQRESGGKYGWR